MIENVLAEKLKEYAPATAIEQEHVLQEMMQHFILSSLGRAGFFNEAAFHGGTFLRIIHKLNRFSEDLDFVLKKPDAEFQWGKYLDRVMRDCTAEGIQFELLDKSNTDRAVKKAFLKTDSIGKLIVIDLPHSRTPKQKLKIKLEIDTHPPEGARFETHYLAFPVMTALTSQDMPSAFASKAHALLCRTYTKGRDWYDFLWYVNRRTRPNLMLLEKAIDQVGPWEEQSVEATPSWFIAQLRQTIHKIDWPVAQRDVQRFLPPLEQKTLSLWNRDFFLYHADKLERVQDGYSGNN